MPGSYTLQNKRIIASRFHLSSISDTAKHFNLILLSFTLLIITYSAVSQTKLTDTARIKTDLIKITKTGESRNYRNISSLNQTAGYIFTEFEKNCDTVFYQTFEIDGKSYKNVIGRFGIKQKTPKLIIGAHYDVCGDQEGADDNASGVTGLLELSRLLKSDSLNNPVELVAYTLEEPPYFGTKFMGSHFHAQSLHESGEEIAGMICLEMIGYFSDKENSQQFPLPGLKKV